RHSDVDLAVGLAANARKVPGVTPSIWMNLPFTAMVAASTVATAETPESLRIAAATWGRSVVGATTSRSAWCSRRSGATWGVAEARGDVGGGGGEQLPGRLAGAGRARGLPRRLHPGGRGPVPAGTARRVARVRGGEGGEAAVLPGDGGTAGRGV